MNAAALGAAIALYGLLSSPAPPVLRGIELAIGALLLIAAGWREPWRLATGQAAAEGPPWRRTGAASLLVLFWLPLLRGLTLGWDADDILRDVVPLFFLFAPLAFVPVLERSGTRSVDVLAGALMLAGVLFALRWWRQTGWAAGALGVHSLDDGLLYFLNAPSVLFAATALPALALAAASRGGFRHLSLAVPAAAGGSVCFAALAAAVHRLSLMLAVPVLLIATVHAARRSRALTLALAAGGIVMAVVWSGTLAGMLALAVEKSRQVGLNARVDEALAAFDQIARSLPSLLLGDGWGALVANPAVGGWRVSYTHTLFTYLLVKTGLIGLAAAAAWLGTLASPLRSALRARPTVVLSALPPLAIALTAHSSFKYLDTGLLLTLVLLCRETAAGETESIGRGFGAARAPHECGDARRP